jgi:hypothetical protein
VSSRTAHRVLSDYNVDFRSRLLEVLDTPPERFFFLDGDTCVCTCPVCDAPMAVHFGDDRDVKADLSCHSDCANDEVLKELRRRAEVRGWLDE